MQIFQCIFIIERLPLLLFPYGCLPMRLEKGCGGIIELVADSISRHEIGNAHLSQYMTLLADLNQTKLSTLQHNFTRSLAAYAILSLVLQVKILCVCMHNCVHAHMCVHEYLCAYNQVCAYTQVGAYTQVCAYVILQIKDRHNANILITKDGCMVHVDFGYILDSSPALESNLTRAPFKFTKEMLDLIGEDGFSTLRVLIIDGLLAIRKFRHMVIALIASYAHDELPCFRRKTLDRLNRRLDHETCTVTYTQRQIGHSLNALSTRLYDLAQSFHQGIKY